MRDESMRNNSIFLVTLAAALLAPAAASAMSLSFSWGPTKACFDPHSPPMRLSHVPKGTVTLRFHMTDLDAPSYPHGGGTVRYTGRSRLGYGAFRYKGPCPPSRHHYRFTVEAIDKSGRVLARARATRPFGR